MSDDDQARQSDYEYEQSHALEISDIPVVRRVLDEITGWPWYLKKEI